MKQKMIGITGPSGAGKSKVSALLRQRGYNVIDADSIAREVTNNDPVTLQKLQDVFGEKIIAEDGSLNRRALGDLAFSSKKATQQLNHATLPQIIHAILRESEELSQENHPFFFIDAPTLYESGLDKECVAVIAVTAQAALRKDRLHQREPDLSKEQISLRLEAQPPEDFYTSTADFIIENDDSIAALENTVDFVLRELLNLYPPTK